MIETVLNYNEHTYLLGPDAVVEKCGYFTTLESIPSSLPRDDEAECETSAVFPTQEAANFFYQDVEPVVDKNIESTDNHDMFQTRERGGRYRGRGRRRGRTNDGQRGRGRGGHAYGGVGETNYEQVRHWVDESADDYTLGSDEINFRQVRSRGGRGGPIVSSGENNDAMTSMWETTGQMPMRRGFPPQNYSPVDLRQNFYERGNIHVSPLEHSSYANRRVRNQRRPRGGVRRPMRGNMGSMENVCFTPNSGAEEQYIGMQASRGHGGRIRPYLGRQQVQASCDDIPSLMNLNLNDAAARRRDSQDSDVGLSRNSSGASLKSGKTKYSREIPVKNEVESEKCSLLVFLINDLKQYQCQVFVNMKLHTVLVSGFIEEDVVKTEELILMKLLNFHTQRLTFLSANFQKRLSSYRGKSWVKELFKRNNLQVVFYSIADRPEIMADGVESADNACKLLRREIRIVKIPYTEMHQSLLKSADWNTFKSTVESNSILSVEVLTKPEMVVSLEGVSMHIEDARQKLEKLLEEKTVEVKEISVDSTSKLSYLKTYYRDFW